MRPHITSHARAHTFACGRMSAPVYVHTQLTAEAARPLAEAANALVVHLEANVQTGRVSAQVKDIGAQVDDRRVGGLCQGTRRLGR